MSSTLFFKQVNSEIPLPHQVIGILQKCGCFLFLSREMDRQMSVIMGACTKGILDGNHLVLKTLAWKESEWSLLSKHWWEG